MTVSYQVGKNVAIGSFIRYDILRINMDLTYSIVGEVIIVEQD